MSNVPGILYLNQEYQGGGMLLVSCVGMLQGALEVSSESGIKVPELNKSAYTHGFRCRSLSRKGECHQGPWTLRAGKPSGDYSVEGG